MDTITFNKSLILRMNQEKTDIEVLTLLASRLCELGLVKDTYKKAILDREEQYPTGLFIGEANVAIPHADIKHVNQASICVGILENPVKFNAMDEPTNEIDVSLVIMMALTEAHGHIDMLQKVVKLIQNQELVKKVIKSRDSQTIYQIIKEELL
ncbi:PTS sugar transporter subunit IIA [Clostridium algidicarnis]|uniref:PTS sugar transporter subunit IIA n=1 Tax=Clostridium algidicarnis TaxID=37659 RepID=UPI0004984739|nr:PTS sugar transporter subunit IIA [Clostridium algidicarnis]